MKRLIFLAGIFAWTLTACGAETGNGLVTAKAGLVSGNNTTNGFSGTDEQGTALTVTSARAYLRHFEFFADKTTKIDGPYAADLITRVATPSLAGLDIPAGNYKRVDARFTMAKMNDGVLSAGDPLLGESFIAGGTIDYPTGQTTMFELALHFEEDASFQNAEGIEIEENGTHDVLLDFDVAGWFSTLPITRCLDDGDLEIENGLISIRDKGPGRCNEIEKSLKDTIKASAKLRKN